jgi:hypothetical protein
LAVAVHGDKVAQASRRRNSNRRLEARAAFLPLDTFGICD